MIYMVIKMTVYFGENLKKLRKANALTQEALADFLGVSFQTISKWERAETYPDITVLPVIADFFGVSVDDLLCTDTAQKDVKISHYLSLYDSMQLKDAAAVFTEFQKAVKEFPNEYPLLVRYMELLLLEMQRLKKDECVRLSSEVEAAYYKIQRYCTDDSIRIRAKRLMFDDLMWKYQCLGFDEKYKQQAETILSSMPSLNDSREYTALFLHCSLEDWYIHYREAIEELSYLLQNTVVGYYYYDDRYSVQDKIRVILLMNRLIQLLDTEENLTKNRIHLIYNNGHLGHLYAEIGDTENALKYLRLAAVQAIDFDVLPDSSERIALFYEQEERFRNMPMSERMYELMTKHYPLSDEFKSTAEFKEIIELLK